MKPKFKTTLLISGIALGCMAIGISAAAIANKEINQLRYADAESYTLTLDSSNAPTIGNSYVDSFVSYAQTSNGNNVYFKMVFAKSSAGNYVQLANRGYLFNHADEGGKITGITGITATLASGSLTIKTTNADLHLSNDAYLGDAASMTSGVKYTEGTPFRYFQLQAGDSGATITSLKIEYTCDGLPSFIPAGKTFYIEDFESFTETGVGNDTSHGKYVTTGLRSAFYSTYYGGTSDPTTGSSSWALMGSTDYLTYSSNKGRNSSKCALFKTNGGNNFRYIQTKAIYGVNSVIGKGAKFSVWMHGAYSNTTATTASANDVNVTVMAFYGSQFNLTSTNGATVKKFTVPANSDWAEYKMELDDYRTYYAFGFYLEKVSPSANVYLPIDDVAIYTTSPYPIVHPTSISLNPTTASIYSGNTVTLTPTVLPDNADNKDVTWSSSNNSVATVDNGVVTGVSVGNATITATTEDGDLTATCEITVLQTQTYLSGTFIGSVTLLGYDFPVQIASGNQRVIAFAFCGVDTGVSSYICDGSSFTIVTANAVSVRGYDVFAGTMTGSIINGTFTNCSITGATVNGTARNPSNNGSITFEKKTSSNSLFNGCDGTTAELQSTFARRVYKNSAWEIDTTNADRITRATDIFADGTGGLRFRSWADGKTAITLASDLPSSLRSAYNNISFWVHNSSSKSVTIKIFMYKGAGWDNNDNIGDYVVASNSWAFVTCGFNYSVYNFQLYTENVATYALTYDNFCLYKS